MTGIGFAKSLSCQIGDSHQDRQKQRHWAIAIAMAIGFCVFLWIGLEIPRGILAHTDELLTAERTREMLLTKPWVVHYNFQRSFEKPPLQYWLSSLTLPRLHNRTLAVRIWPLLYGCLTMIAIGWLVFLVEPGRPWLVPLTVAILASCPLFSREASRAFLDSGLTFFTVAAVLFAQLARNRPVWWLVVATACWLGSLQKFPMPFLVWLLIILVRLTSRTGRQRLRSGWLIGSILLAIAAMAVWPLIQITKYGMSMSRLFHEGVVVWTGPTELGSRPYFEVLIGLSTIGGACGLLSFLAAFVVLFSKKEGAPPAVREISIVSLAVIGLVIVSNFRGVRYVEPIVPCLCFLLSLVFYQFFQSGPPVRAGALVVLVGLLTAGFVQTKIQIDHARKNPVDEKLIAEKLGALQRPGTKTLLITAEGPRGDLLWDSFYLFHGNFRFPVTHYTADQMRRERPKPPLIGACVARDFPIVQEAYPSVEVQLTRAQFLCWRVPAQQSAPSTRR